MFALVKYLAYQAYEELIFALLDSLEAINSDRIAVIVGYISDYVDYLIVAAFPEDTEGLDSE